MTCFARAAGARGRREQLFHLSHVTTPQRVANVLVFYPGQSAGQTRASAASCKLEPRNELQHPTIRLDDGTLIRVDLAELQVTLPEAATPAAQ